ncbi:MAG: monoterpene epsilon-lactone hydrolase [Oleiphilaceae bacterium]|jgi:monoterpene epsilon-lactone hydrolase
MLAALDVFFTLLKTFFSCLLSFLLSFLLSSFKAREKLPKRSWRGEFIFRLAKSLLSRSIGKDFEWIRDRQNLLTLYSPDLFKVSIQKTQIAGVACIALQPKKIPEVQKVIVYFHGGGYAVGSAQAYQLMAAKLALMCQAKVVLVDYRLVPEFTLPAAQEDCHSVTQAIIKQYAQHKIILMGDSAGGALCLSTLKRLKGALTGEPDSLGKISASVLISPWVAPLSYKNLSLENEATDMLDRHITQYWVDTFYQSETQRQDIDFIDIKTLGLAKEHWPKLYLQAAGAEVFLKQIQGLSTQLDELGVKHDFDIFTDQFHVFQTFSPLVPEAKDALKGIADFVRSV